jgi:hypothetical protein
MKTVVRVEDDSADEKPAKRKSDKAKKTAPLRVSETELPVVSYVNGEEEKQSKCLMPV